VWGRAVLEKLTVPQLVKKLPAFYGTRSFVTVFTGVLVAILSQMNPVGPPPLHVTRTMMKILRNDIYLCVCVCVCVCVSDKEINLS